MAKSLSNAKTGKESIKHIGRVGRAYRLAKPSCRRANTICKKNEVGERRSGGEERAGLNKRRRVAPKGRVGIARLGRLALEFRGNCAAERIKPLTCLGTYGEWGTGNGERGMGNVSPERSESPKAMP